MAANSNFLKRYAAWVTNLTADPFGRARLRLSVFYSLTITLLLIFVSVVVYITFLQNLRGNAEGNYVSNQAQSRAILREESQLRSIVIGTDAVVLFLTVGTGWWLAGRTLQPIQKMLQAQKHFVANASHDLRTPLAIMKTSTELGLRAVRPSDPAYATLTSNLEEIDNMNQLTEELLALARSDTPVVSMKFEKIDMSTLTARIAQKLRAYAATDNITISLTAAKKAYYVEGNPLALERALTNILKNAVAYSESGSVIHIKLDADSHTVKWACRDSGQGIQHTDLPNVFSRFYRGTGSQDAPKPPGSGLGLAIVKEIVQQHRGQISIESTPGQGTTVLLTLPRFPSSY